MKRKNKKKTCTKKTKKPKKKNMHINSVKLPKKSILCAKLAVVLKVRYFIPRLHLKRIGLHRGRKGELL